MGCCFSFRAREAHELEVALAQRARGVGLRLQEAVEEQHGAHAGHTQLLADDRENEVGVRLGQVEDLLHRLPEPAAEEPARPQRDLPLDRLKARPAGVRPRVEKGRQPRPPVGRADRVQEDEESCRRGAHASSPPITSCRRIRAGGRSPPRGACSAPWTR